MVTKNILKFLFFSSIFGIGIVVCLFILSEEKIKRNNSFLRRYMPHPIQQISSMDLKYNSYYIAGIYQDKIYLGNTTAPLNLTIIDTSLQSTEKIRVSVDQMDLPYRHIRITVVPPFFYITDGSVPIIFQGSISNWEANTLLHNVAYFSQLVTTDTNEFVIKAMNSETQENSIGILKAGDSNSLYLSNQFLEKQIDGIFDTDGLLLWNLDKNKIVYVYYYRNQYIVSESGLDKKYIGKTIDTISQAQLDFAYFPSKNQRKIDRRSIKVNNYSTTSGNYLFIHSDRLGKYEPEDMLKKASIIDVYNLEDKGYEFSFYLFHHKSKKMKSFQVYKHLLVAVMDNELVTYQLNKRFFETD